MLDHCHRALWLTLQRGLGAHRLLLMGSGDWNDGFDAMGHGAESVWLTWFASIVFHRFSLLLEDLGEPDALQPSRNPAGCWTDGQAGTCGHVLTVVKLWLQVRVATGLT